MAQLGTFLSVFAALLLLGCGGDTEGNGSASDAGGDGAPPDCVSPPCGTGDAGADARGNPFLDGSSTPDGSSAPDGALDCGAVGCGPAPLCDEVCGSPCGCCGCAPGDTITVEGVVYECAGTCYAPREEPCPSSAPGAGRACAREATVCTYVDCAGDGVVTATCAGGTWDVSATPCGENPCGSETCGAGDLCVERVGGAFLVECAPNPCGTGPIDCDCAGSFCGGFQCTTFETTVRCNTCSSGICP